MLKRKERFGRIGVLAGGSTSEREISLRSGNAVYNALKEEGLDVILVDLRDLGSVGEIILSTGINTAFIVLHGGFGEDGTIQKILEEMKIPYTGSGPEASRLALDKAASRIRFAAKKLNVPKYKVLAGGEPLDVGGLDLPLVVKPRNEGSSIGLSTVHDVKDLSGATDNAFKYGDKILIEEFIKGRELTVGILDDKPLPVVEIVPEHGCYDYKAKYESAKTRYLVPAPVDNDRIDWAKKIGLAAHRSLGCKSFSRVDIMMDAAGEMYVLEVNTIPGLTSRSLLPKAAEAEGIRFPDLCKKILGSVKK